MDCFERIREIVHEATGVPVENISENTTLAQLDMDSLDLCEVMLAVEEEFDIIVENEEDLHTVHDIECCIEAAVA